jgi:hypothetical protein
VDEAEAAASADEEAADEEDELELDVADSKAASKKCLLLLRSLTA